MAQSFARRAFLGTALGGAVALGTGTARAHGPARRPDTLATPPGFQPEGIALGPGPSLYTGSLLDGSIYRADPVTGHGRIISDGGGTVSAGLTYEPGGRLVVAGGDSGLVKVIDARRGTVLAALRAETRTCFVNDVKPAFGAAWITESFQSSLYRLSLDRWAPTDADLTRIELTGEWEQAPDNGWTANGIETTPDGRAFILSNHWTGKLYRVNPRTGHATALALSGSDGIYNGDGLLRRGRTLYVVQNWEYAIDVLRLSADGTRADFVRRITDPRFDEPTTVTATGGRLYVTNAGFDSDWTDPAMSSTIVAIPL
ncbi:hypothetical protein SRB5_34190 [Streptomyces sp. RB5]|uniref:Superoxide dismutase n=1 Tax=Streptomyces smaragdinus TaxID=2585196 RepID=A0A7K0CIG6_9ACTN|nr:SMP-30/gluconolactonase/LRE family protein [Streptomyces smaragdinus]MQY13275.1 hypothetical protein [Streptomyces smaragdinus]